MPPPSPASSEGSTGMVPYSYRIRGSVSRRDLRMIDLVLQEELRVREKIIRDTSQCGRGSRSHQVAIGLSSGEVLEEFEIADRVEAFEDLLSRIERRREGTRHL